MVAAKRKYCSPGSGPSARLGAVAFIHRFGSTLNAHLHFHCVVIDGVFDSAAAGGVVFHAATGLDEQAFADVQERVRRRLLRVFVRRGLLAGEDARAMAQWEHGGGFSVDGSVRIEAADRAGASVCCATAPARRSPWNGYASAIASTSSTTTRNRGPATVARSS